MKVIQKKINPKTIKDGTQLVRASFPRVSFEITAFRNSDFARGINLINFHQRRLESRTLLEFEGGGGKKRDEEGFI